MTTRFTGVSPRRPDDVVADEPAVAAGAVASARISKEARR